MRSCAIITTILPLLVTVAPILRILLAEDEEATAAAVSGVLAALGHEVSVAADGLSAWQMLQEEHFPVILSDWMMPGLDGPTLCRRIRSLGNSPYTYIILLSARDRHVDRMEGLRAGADDFMVKPAHADELAVRLDIARRILDTQAELERQNVRLEALATTDELTGLKNRRRFFEALESHFALADRQRSPLSLVMLDVDHFKSYNDAFGHPAGDEVLRGVAEVLRTGCRAHDTAARYGGEEFVVLLPATGPVVARGMAERLRLAVERRDWPHCPVTASFGIATMTARTRQRGDLVEQADLALYHSKNHGRNRVSHMIDLGMRTEVGASRISAPKCSIPDLADPAVEDPRNGLGVSLSMGHAGGRLAEAYDNIVDGLSKALNLRDSETSEHSRRVTELTMRMVRSLDFGLEELCHIRRGVLLHDIGKMGVPDRILHKPGPLSDVEWTEMRKHPSHALEMLEPIGFLRPAMEIPYAHHERWDGTGYPRGLKGEQIPLAARAFAVVDVYDALTHDRPYRAAWPGDRALAHIDNLAGVHFDPEMVVALHRALGPDD